MKILYCDSHTKVSRVAKSLMEGFKIVTSVDTVSDGETAISRLENEQYDLVVLGISLPGIDGIEVLKIIKKRWSKTPVLMFSFYISEEYALLTLKLGASGYLEKPNASEHLEEAITTINQGKKYISKEVAALLAERKASNAKK